LWWNLAISFAVSAALAKSLEKIKSIFSFFNLSATFSAWSIHSAESLPGR
jgi:hypothetical protein